MNSFYTKYLKKLIDITISLISLILLSPLLLLVSILIRIDSKGPAFFKQQRLGKSQVPFLLYKFRTMSHKTRNVHRQIFDGDSEVTRLGSFLRRTKIDELPQLVNVFLGNMSIVGPRPCLPEAKAKFGKFSKNRFEVKPGLSSLAAVKGSIYLTWEQKGIYDYLYVKNESLQLDLWIIYSTLKVVLKGEKKMFGNQNLKRNK